MTIPDPAAPAEQTLRLDVGEGGQQRSLAVLRRPGRGPEVVWLGGFRSEMRASKAERLAAWAGASGQAMTRFDYTGHGASGGAFEAGTIGLWLDDTLAVLERVVEGPPVLVGSSMGGWLALLAARRLAGTARQPIGLVLIAPAADFTQDLLWPALPEEARADIMERGAWLRPTPYAAEPMPITRALIQEGRDHLILGGTVEPGCPVHILQGLADPDVPWRHALRLVERLAGAEVVLTLVKDGDHRLSRPEDLDRLEAAVAAMAAHHP